MAKSTTPVSCLYANSSRECIATITTANLNHAYDLVGWSDTLALLVLLWGLSDGQACCVLAPVRACKVAHLLVVMDVLGGRDCLSLSAFSESLRTRV